MSGSSRPQPRTPGFRADQSSASRDRRRASGRRSIPIVLGGNSLPAVRRAAQVGDGWFPYTIGADDFARGADRIREIATAAGRSEDAVEMTIWPGSFDFTREFDADYVRPYVAAGASRLVLTPPMFGPESLLNGVESLAGYVDRYRNDVVATL
ncbi:LLM class flavin-dependent oxidoreductase [Nocardia sp. NPDC055321]